MGAAEEVTNTDHMNVQNEISDDTKNESKNRIWQDHSEYYKLILTN